MVLSRARVTARSREDGDSVTESVKDTMRGN